MRFSVSIDIHATPAAVWAVLEDVERWPEWTPTMTSVKRLDEGRLAVGSRARIRQPRLPPAVWTVTALDAGRGFTWVGRGPGIVTTADHWIEPVGDGCRVMLAVAFTGPLGAMLGWITRSLTARYIRREAQGLKERAESGS